MNLEKLTKQLRRDVAANPKKAALLGLMVVVALYFWGPLVWKFASVAGGKPRSNANLASLILTDDPADSPQQGKTRSGGKFRWDKVRQIIRQDPHMLPAVFDPNWVNPFGRSVGARMSGPIWKVRCSTVPGSGRLERVSMCTRTATTLLHT